jgi:hypothetical protein
MITLVVTTYFRFPFPNEAIKVCEFAEWSEGEQRQGIVPSREEQKWQA